MAKADFIDKHFYFFIFDAHLLNPTHAFKMQNFKYFDCTYLSFSSYKFKIEVEKTMTN